MNKTTIVLCSGIILWGSIPGLAAERWYIAEHVAKIARRVMGDF
jgi:hypothetical protein